MAYKVIGTAEPEYLAATDILIGDMSNTNYEFLLYDRPIILLANKWLLENFPDIGIKTDLQGLGEAIQKSIKYPDEFKEQRRFWREKTIYTPDGLSAKRYIDIMLERSGFSNPPLVFIHGDSSVRKTNLIPLVREAERRGFKTSFVTQVNRNKEYENIIYIAAHFEDLNIEKGYKVHIDHDFKGKATVNTEQAIKDYRANDYFPLIDLHVTAGEAGDERTKLVLGPLKDRTIIGGYPKADDLIRLNTPENRKSVCLELGFDENKPIITYAPAGEESYMKPGGSLNNDVLNELKKLSERTGYNYLVKLKHPPASLVQKVKRKIKGLMKKSL